jgi:hypothetical protein
MKGNAHYHSVPKNGFALSRVLLLKNIDNTRVGTESESCVRVERNVTI